MIRHTTLNLDTELLAAAQEALGTTQTTETVHRALEEVINARKRRWLAEYEFPDLTPESVEAMRQVRTLVDPDAQSSG